VGETAKFMHLRWEIPMLVFLVPTLWYGWIVLTEKFPVSEAAAAGVEYREMLLQFASPILLLLLVLHACVGYVELGTDSWITTITESFTQQGFLLFIYASTIMFVLRFFAGPIVERINPLGLLCVSALLGMCGLLFLSYIPAEAATAAALAWVAVTIYGVGKTFLWPTMLGVVGERFPKGGALAMGAMGGVGMLSAGILGGPGIGYKQDYFASQRLDETAPQTYERYAAPDEKGFLVFPAVRGLDGRKVGVLLDNPPAKELNRSYEIKEQQGELDENKDLVDLYSWWNSTAKPYADEDKPRIQDVRIFGGQMALRYTAAVPAAMFVGYLLLVLYFAARGGYRVERIGAHDTKHAVPPVEKSEGEEYTGGVQGPVA
jgi:hypothetical protein